VLAVVSSRDKHKTPDIEFIAFELLLVFISLCVFEIRENDGNITTDCEKKLAWCCCFDESLALAFESDSVWEFAAKHSVKYPREVIK
jgi:hypothetical protein